MTHKFAKIHENFLVFEGPFVRFLITKHDIGRHKNVASFPFQNFLKVTRDMTINT